jgi:hypothetical protein
MTASEADAGTTPAATEFSTAGTGLLARRARAPRPAIQGLLALVLYLAFFIVSYTLPLVLHPSLPQIGQSQVDPNFYIWSWRWWTYALSHGLNPLYSRQIGAPAGTDLSWATTTPAVAVFLAPVTAVFGPITSFNLTLVLGAPVSAWAAFIAARRLTGNFWAALMAGTVYGFSWYEVAETGAGHPNLTVIMVLPLMVYLVLLWRDGTLGRWSFVTLLAIAMAMEFYIFNETFVEMTVLGAAGLLIGFLLARPAERPMVVRLAGLAAIAYAAALVLVSPYLIYSLRHAPAHFAKAASWSSLNLQDLVVPRSGLLLLALVLAVAMFARSSRLGWLLIILFVLTLVIGVGPVLQAGTHDFGSLPWAGLWNLPFARAIEPLRVLIFAYLVLAMMLAVWLTTPFTSRALRAFQWLLGLAVVAAVVAYVPTAATGRVLPAASAAAGLRPTNALPPFLSTGLYRRYLRPGEIVVVISDRGNAGMLFQADTNFYMRIAGGFINRTFSGDGLPTPVANLIDANPTRERQFLAYVHRAGVGAVLVEQAWSSPWMQVFSQMGLHGTPAGGVIVYRTG